MSDSKEFSDFFYSSSDGLRLHARVYGREHRASALPVVCLPGLTRNVRDFHELALSLSRHEARPRMVVSFDYRGRGLSEYDSDWRRYDVLVETADTVAGLTALDIEHAGFVGSSRGGLIIHLLAAMRPGALKAIVLNDVGPVVNGEGLAKIRTYLERAPRPRDWVEAVEIQKMSHGDAFPALKDEDWERVARAIYVERDGKLAADFDPKLVKTVTSVDLSQPLPQLWPQFVGLTAVPMLVIRGENSKLLSEETVEKMNALHPRMHSATIRGQDHTPLLETADLPERIRSFLAKAEH
ncbi:MAG: alpha/beta fold hydrolase [Rhizobiaceae bacterium]